MRKLCFKNITKNQLRLLALNKEATFESNLGCLISCIHLNHTHLNTVNIMSLTLTKECRLLLQKGDCILEINNCVKDLRVISTRELIMLS